MFRCCANHLKLVNDKIQRVKFEENEAVLLFNAKHLYTKVRCNSKSTEVASNSSDEVDSLSQDEPNAQTALKNETENEVLLKSETDKLYRITEDLTSFSIFGSEATDDCGIRYEGTDKNISVPSVTHILSKTMSFKAKQALELWKKCIIDTFGERHFRELCKALLNDGKLFHSCIQDTLLHKELVVSPRVKSAYLSVKPILDDIKSVEAVEAMVIHPTLRYKGIVDCIATYRDNVYVIDWKKSDKQKKNLAATFDAPVQLAAYIGAVNASNVYPLPIDRGLVVVGYTNGSNASVHELNKNALQKAWGEWLRRLQLFYTKLNEKDEQQ